MTYFIRPSASGAEALNKRGLENNRDTKQWGTVIKHPTLSEWANGVEQADLECFMNKQLPTHVVPVSESEMLANGWVL